MNYTEKSKMIDKVSLVVIMGICVEFFLYVVDYCFSNRIDLMLAIPRALMVFGAIFLAVSIYLFYRTFKKGEDKHFIYGIEFLILSFLCPFLTYCYYPKFFGLTTNFIHSIPHKTLWGVVLIYYIIRVIYTLVNDLKKYNKKPVSFKKNKIKN